MPSNRSDMLSYIVSIGLAMCLKILPLPGYLSQLNPDWVLLALIYWTLAIPEKIGVFNAWFLGIIIDVLTGRTLGQQALAYSLVSYACLKLHKRLRQYPVFQQSFFIFCCLLSAQVMVFWIENIQSSRDMGVSFWLPVFAGTLCWPLVFTMLRIFRIKGL